jgi:outer membrane protein assembly factor BamB
LVLGLFDRSSSFTVAWSNLPTGYFNRGIFDQNYLYIAAGALTIINAKDGTIKLQEPGRFYPDDSVIATKEFVFYMDTGADREGFGGTKVQIRGSISCFNRKTAELIWKKKTQGTLQSIDADESGLYALANGSKLERWNLKSGLVLWTKSLDNMKDVSRDNGSLTCDGTHVVVTRNFQDMFAFAKDSGKPLWKMSEHVGFNPFISNGNLISRSKTLQARNLNTGAIVWKIPFSEGNTDVMVRNSRLFYKSDDQVLCLNLSDGKVLWSKSIFNLKDAKPQMLSDATTWHLHTAGDLNLDLNGDKIWEIKSSASFK